MKNIFLFRHGKSSWSDPMFDDHERPLADRGIRDVPLISKIINEKCSNIDLVLCSSAKRTIETLNLCMQHINGNRQTEILDELYLSSSENILKILNNFLSKNNNIILIGHNPGLYDFVNSVDHLNSFLFPTAGLCHLILQKNTTSFVNFSDLKIVTTTKPKDILLK